MSPVTDQRGSRHWEPTSSQGRHKFFRILSLSKHTFSNVLEPLRRPWGAHPTPLWNIKQLWYHCLNPPCSLTHGAKLSPSLLPQLLGCSQTQAQSSRPQGLCMERRWRKPGRTTGSPWPWQWMDSYQHTTRDAWLKMSETKPEEGNQDQKLAKQKETHRKAKAPMVPWSRLSRSLSTDSLSHAHNPPAFSLSRLIIKFQAGVYGYITACLTYTKIN